MEIIIKTLGKERDRAREVVEALVDSEMHYLFTNDKDYKENRQDIVQPSTENNMPTGDMRGGHQEDEQEHQN